MSKRRIQLLASVLVLAALVLLAGGLAAGQPWAWGSGLLAVAIAMVLSFATRWMDNRGGGPPDG